MKNDYVFVRYVRKPYGREKKTNPPGVEMRDRRSDRANRRNACRSIHGIRYWRTHGMFLDPHGYQPTAFYRARAPYGGTLQWLGDKIAMWANPDLIRQPGRWNIPYGKLTKGSIKHSAT
jgi:hypothetical protein